MPFAADPVQQQPDATTNPKGFVPDPGQKSTPPTTAKDVAMDWGSAAVRQPALAAIRTATFIPDFATSLVNVVANAGEKLVGAKHGEEAVMPSSYFEGLLDQVTRAPTTKAGKIAENVGATVLSGGRSLGKLAADLPTTVPKLVSAGMAKLTGHASSAGLSRVTTQFAEQAHNAGLDVSPSYVGGKVAKTVQAAAGGAAKVDRVISEGNMPKIDRLAKTSLGLHPAEQLDEFTFETLKKENYAKYDALGSTGKLAPDPLYNAKLAASGGRFAQRSSGFGGGYRYESIAKEKATYLGAAANEVTAQEAIDEVRALRNTSRQNLKNYDPEKNALGAVQRQIADAIDGRLDRHAQNLLKNKVIDKNVYQGYVTARENLAKIATVEDSIGPGGHVIAQSLANALDKGVKLTGGLKIIAETTTQFPRSMQFVGAKGSEGVWAPLDFLIGGAGVLAHNPKAAALAIARPVARAGLATKPVQAAMIKGTPRLNAAVGMAARGAAISGSEALQEKKKDSDE